VSEREENKYNNFYYINWNPKSPTFYKLQGLSEGGKEALLSLRLTVNRDPDIYVSATSSVQSIIIAYEFHT
jgi:hypothetical protein